jgi:hypothetical protein
VRGTRTVTTLVGCKKDAGVGQGEGVREQLQLFLALGLQVYLGLIFLGLHVGSKRALAVHGYFLVVPSIVSCSYSCFVFDWSSSLNVLFFVLLRSQSSGYLSLS